MLMLTLKHAAALPFQNTVYSVRHGLARGLKRRGGLGFLARPKPPTVEEAFLADLPLRGCTVYDVGSLEGMYTIFFARAVGANGRVIAFEPNPKNCQAIRDHVDLNGFRNVQLHEVGLGDRRGEAELVIPFGVPGRGTVRGDLQQHYLRQARAARVKIRIESLDEFREAQRLQPPDVIKIDVEGMEFPVLQGAIHTLKAFRPRLFIELHGLEESDRAANVRQIVTLLKEIGYTAPLHVETGLKIDATSEVPFEGHLWVS